MPATHLPGAPAVVNTASPVGQAQQPADGRWRFATARAEVSVVPLRAGRWHVSTRSLVGDPVPRASCETSFPLELVQRLLRTTSPEWICDALARHEDPAYVRGEMQSQLLAYFPRDAYAGKRLLDFGCGNGASTMAIAELLPRTEVTGVELDRDRLDEAAAILEHRGGLDNVRFLRSPSGESLPDGIGTFDFVMLSAVFEHLLPAERHTVMPLIWSHMRPGAVIFINQTPYRWFPHEHHSTGLWGINYLPDGLAWRLAHRHGMGTRGRTWEAMLRGGIRGGTELAMRRALTGGQPERAEILQPRVGVRDRADYWLQTTSPRRRMLKRGLAAFFRFTDRWAGTIPTLNVSVALRKRD